MPSRTLVSKKLLKRIAYIDSQLAKGIYPNKKCLSKYLVVSQKTIQRDLDFMKTEYDAPIQFDKRRHGFYYTQHDFRMNPLTVQANDFLAVAVTEKILEQYKDSPYAVYFKSFHDKLYAMFDEKLSIDIKDLDKILSYNLSPVRNVESGIMSVVQQALENNRSVIVIYFTGSSGRTSDRKLDIYHLRNYNGDWYIVANCHASGEIKIFALSRIKKIKLTNQHFDVPDNFNIEDYFKDSFGIFKNKGTHEVKLKITGDMVRYITERKWHKSEKLTRLADGSITLEYKVSDLTEIKFWALSMGESCQVLKPKSLRSEIKSILKKSLSHYK